jgi:hypothetical protein
MREAAYKGHFYLMKKIFLLPLLAISAGTSFSQQQVFDIINFNAPRGWKKEKSESAIQFTKQDDAKGIYCIITLMKSIPGTANAKENFDAAWETVVKEMVQVSAAPEMQPPATEDGWEAQSGYAPFESEGTKGIALLVTSSGYQKMVNILILTNTDVYEKDMAAFLESVSFTKPDLENSTTANNQQNTDNSENNFSVPSELIKQSWKNTQNRKDVNGSYAGYSSNTYQFKPNGTYTFNSTAFQNYTPKYNITDEEGTYQVSGNTITLKPTKSHYHIHQREKNDPPSKSGNLALEATQYSLEFTIIYNKQRLVLSPVNGNETKRDGTFNYYADGKMQKSYLYDAGDLLAVQTGVDTTTKPAVTNQNNGYAFTTTNFDNGWTSTIYDDYVLTTKGNLKVYLSYIEKFNESEYSGTGKEKRHHYWNTCVAKYFTTGEMRYNPGGALSDYSSDYIEGEATDKQTGEKRYIAMILNIIPYTGRLSVIIASAPDATQFRRQFPFADDKWKNDLLPMYGYNKFAAGKNDLTGTWSSSGGGTMSWYSTTTGNYAGATGAATADVFSFNTNGTYSSEHKGGYGVVGAMNTYQQKYKGAYTLNNWELAATNRWDGKTEQYNTWLEVVKGGRILHMDAGGGKSYTLYKEK